MQSYIRDFVDVSLAAIGNGIQWELRVRKFYSLKKFLELMITDRRKGGTCERACWPLILIVCYVWCLKILSKRMTLDLYASETAKITEPKLSSYMTDEQCLQVMLKASDLPIRIIFRRVTILLVSGQTARMGM